MARSLQILIVVAVAVAALALSVAKFAARGSQEYPYTATDTLLTQGELAFQRILSSVTPERICINSKVRLADIIKVDSGLNKSRRSAAFAKIQSKHIDFVLCDRASMKIVCAIKLHDKSHASDKRVERDEFVRQAFATARVPYLEVKASRAYNPNELRERINKACGNYGAI